MRFNCKKLCCLIGLLSCIVSCGKSVKSDSILSGPQITPLYRAYIRYPSRNLDPAKFDDAGSAFVATQIYCTLFEQEPALDIKPILVEKWKMDANRTRYNFILRNDIFFNNGDRITANDVVYSLTRHLNKSSIINADFSIIEKITPISERELEIVLKKPFPFFLYFLTNINTAILSERQLTSLGKAYFENPVGCGSFVLSETQKDRIILKKNPHAVRKPFISQMELYYNMDIDAAIKMFNEGLLDDISMAWFDPKDVFLMNYKVLNKELFQTNYFLLYNEKFPFSDANIRKAFVGLFDRDALVDKLSDKRIVKANGYIPKGVIGYNNKEELYKKVDLNEFSSSETYKSIKKKYSLPINITVTASNLFNKEALEQTVRAKAFQAIFNAKLEFVDPPEVLNRYYNRYGNAILVGDSLRYPDPYFMLSYFKSDNPHNDVNVRSKRIDQYIDDAIVEENKLKRSQLYQGLEKEIEKEAVILPLFYGGVASEVVRNNVNGLNEGSIVENCKNYYAVWIER